MPIKSFKCADTESLFKRQRVKRFANIESVTRRKLEQLEWAGALDDLRVPPGGVVGIVGAFLAGFLLPALGISFSIVNPLVTSIAYATIGAVILLLLIGLVRRAK